VCRGLTCLSWILSGTGSGTGVLTEFVMVVLIVHAVILTVFGVPVVWTMMMMLLLLLMMMTTLMLMLLLVLVRSGMMVRAVLDFHFRPGSGSGSGLR